MFIMCSEVFAAHTKGENKMFIGAHVSIAQGLTGAVKAAQAMQANTFQFFIRNPRGGQARKLDEKDLRQAHELMIQYGFGPIVGHAPYTYNLASTRPGIREFTIRTLKDDLERARVMKLSRIVLHPGTHGEQGEEKGLELIVQGLKEVLSAIGDDDISILIEGMAGEGSEIGYSFAHLKSILQGCGHHPRLAFCLDSAHLTGAGYDLSQWAPVKAEFDRAVGMDRLKAFHLNDTVYPLSSKRDRHAKLGEGCLGVGAIRQIAEDEDIHQIPLILETPNDNAGYAKEIALIKAWVRGEA